MPVAKIRSIELSPRAADLDAESGEVKINVGLEDGSASSFPAATFDRPSQWASQDGKDFHFGAPVLFVSRLDQEMLGKAVVAMAEEMSGFWLRYYKTLGPAQARKKA